MLSRLQSDQLCCSINASRDMQSTIKDQSAAILLCTCIKTRLRVQTTTYSNVGMILHTCTQQPCRPTHKHMQTPTHILGTLGRRQLHFAPVEYMSVHLGSLTLQYVNEYRAGAGSLRGNKKTERTEGGRMEKDNGFSPNKCTVWNTCGEEMSVRKA